MLSGVPTAFLIILQEIGGFQDYKLYLFIFNHILGVRIWLILLLNVDEIYLITIPGLLVLGVHIDLKQLQQTLFDLNYFGDVPIRTLVNSNK